VLRIYLNRSPSNAAATLGAEPVQTASTAPIAFVFTPAACTIWETLSPEGPEIWLLPTLSTAALTATGTSTRIWTILPCPKAKRATRRNKRIQSKIAGLFEHRHLFVKHTLTAKDKKVLGRIRTGLPHLRALRAIMDEVYDLFDRRCRMDTALERLARLRGRIRRFRRLAKTLKKLFWPNLEKSLTFLDDSLLPATSNAAERANRRHRKMQKSIYRVRTGEHISQHIAVDMQREAYIAGRNCTIKTLHSTRTGQIRKTA
jgi:hypothetical protein